ncbi:MAG TPA: fructosamine kinase family protein [Casimicrobiaceae bacterium]|nr:fructosamine kinase family protein [Casimicrobiaceae bacterium]
MDDEARRIIERAVGAAAPLRWRDLGATGWAHAYALEASNARVFVKSGEASRVADMLDCEADGLRAISDTHTVRIPEVVATGRARDYAFLALEWLDMTGASGGAVLAAALARLHQAAAPSGPHGERFGWHRDNWIGGTPQQNDWCDDWCAFFARQRLAPQFARAIANGFASAIRDDGERVLCVLPTLLRNHSPAASLVHGDLWSGNAATLASGEPVVFDPAVHVGDRESDLAMAELFGGFDGAFFGAYREAWPLDDEYETRRDVYQLYHLLNHLNLFGAGYLSRVRRSTERILAAAR